jgi:hypothetical protein
LLAVDLGHGEVADHLDAALLEHVAERRRRARLGERPLERRRVDDLDLVAHAALGEERVGQERELQRRDRALDGHLGDVDHEPPALGTASLSRSASRALERVEVERRLAPAGPVSPGVCSGRMREPVATISTS